MKKAQTREETYKKLCVEKNFLGVLEEMHVILEEVEGELAKHNAGLGVCRYGRALYWWFSDFNRRDWWLCSSRFTIADVELTILLVRISQLGLEHVFWEAGKRPYIERYYERVKLRDSFKKTVPGTLVLLKTILMTQAPIIIGVVAALALVVGGAIIAAKFA